MRIALLAGGLYGCSGKSTPEAHHAGHEGGHHHRFDDAAHWSKVFDDPARDECQKPAAVVAAMTIELGMTVADVGAGTGILRASSIDRVLVVDTWHHIDDRPTYAKKLAAALRPGGVVFVVDFNRGHPGRPG